jgi:hypothetical protein
MKSTDLLLKERTTTIGLDNKRFPLNLPPVGYRARCMSQIIRSHDQVCSGNFSLSFRGQYPVQFRLGLQTDHLADAELTPGLA